MSWSETTLGQHIELISGPAFKSRFFTDDPSDVPLVKGENIGQGMILWDKSKYWPHGDASEHEKFKLQPGDVVLAMDRPWVTAGLKFAVINERDPESLLVQRVARIRGTNGLNSKFLRYVISSSLFSGYVRNIQGGTNVPHISGDQIRAFRFAMPSMREQESIASILSAYDDLIENNRRRIQLLEQAARLLYKEWFVHLRFPGHEHTKIHNGIPEGWEKEQVKVIIGKVTRPKKIQKADYLESGDIPCVDQSREFIGGYTDDEEATIDIGKSVIVFGDHTRVLKYISFPFACGADGTQLIVSNDEMMSQEYLFFALDAIDLSNYFYARHFKFLKDQYILRPSNMLLSQFTDIARPIMKQIDTLRSNSERLTKARDLLLPRLMNGSIAT